MALLAILLAAAAANDYSATDNWLCLPGHADACDTSEDATIVRADGSMTLEKFKPVKDAPVDCFYVYPTVSRQDAGNSDMHPGPEEIGVIAQQFARLGSVCSTYAPIYRQTTMKALSARLQGHPLSDVDPALGARDISDAWSYYLAHFNHGRGVVLVGHSQGSGVLIELIKKEIDGKPVQKQILSVILAGTRFQVAKGSDVGGDFQKMKLCHSASDLGCVIPFASFRASTPPPANSYFGKSAGPDTVAGCVNPAAIAGGSGAAQAYLPTAGHASGHGAAAEPWVAGKTVQTPFVSLPGLITAECAHNEVANYLAITVHGDPKDPRVDDIPGDVIVGGAVQQQWGLHLIDMNLFMGNFVDLVRAESKAYLHK